MQVEEAPRRLRYTFSATPGPYPRARPHRRAPDRCPPKVEVTRSNRVGRAISVDCKFPTIRLRRLAAVRILLAMSPPILRHTPKQSITIQRDLLLRQTSLSGFEFEAQQP